MKFHIPELKFLHVVLTIWWCTAMLAGLAGYFLKQRSLVFPYAPSNLLEKHTILLAIGTYFIATQIFTLRRAMSISKDDGSLIEKWQRIMAQTHLLQITNIPLLVLLSIGYAQYPVASAVNENLLDWIIGPGTYSVSYPLYRLKYIVQYIFFGTVLIAYLHVRILAAWISLAGLVLRFIDLAKIVLVILGLAILLEYTTSTLIEPTIYQGYGRSCGYEEKYSSDFSEDCRIYWTYRNVNRVVESFEYSYYGTLSGGLQFINVFKIPAIYYHKEELIINWEFIRNFLVGILSPSIQWFFIMSYLKKRNFEKAKRGYAA